MTFDPAHIPARLKHDYASGRCAVLVGAGASAGAGLPLWGKLLENMIATCLANHMITEEVATQYRSLSARTDKYTMIASGLKEAMASGFDEFIYDSFIAPKPKLTALHEELVKLEKLQFYLTTNYDTLLERAYRDRDPDVPVCTFQETGEIQRRLARREFFILKAHGDATKLGSGGVILTDADYRNLIFRQRGYQSLLSTMFTMFTIIFIGASMTDPEVLLLLNFISDAFNPGSGPAHYALMAKEDTTHVERERWRKDFNVHLIPISKSDGYSEVTEFLTALRDGSVATSS